MIPGEEHNYAHTTVEAIFRAVHLSWWSVDADFGVGSESQYAEYGVCAMPALTMNGRAEIAEGYAARQAHGVRLSRHLITNLVLGVHSSGAPQALYVVTVFAAHGAAPQPLGTPSAICDVTDTFTRHDNRWLIARRELETVFISDSNDSVLLSPKPRR